MEKRKKDLLTDYININMKDMGQWMSTLHMDIGLGRARSRVADLFQDRHYKVLFNDFDSGFQSSRYTDLVSITWSGLFIHNLIYWLSESKQSFARISKLLLIKALYSAIISDGELSLMIGRKLKGHLVGHRNIPRNIIVLASKYVERFRRLQKQKERRDPNYDFSNYFKSDDLTKLSYRKIFTDAEVKMLSRALKKTLTQIK